jgi:hypothetical protein
MSIQGRGAAFLGKAVIVGLGVVLATACADAGIPIQDLRGQVQGGSQRTVEQVFATKHAVIALVDNRQGVLFAATDSGDIFAITDVNKAERLCRGLETGETSWRAFAANKAGDLITNTIRNGKDVLVKVSATGALADLTEVDGHVLSLANDSQGTLYVATWASEGNVSISLNPRALAGAEFIVGRIYQLPAGGNPVLLYEGSIPVWIDVSRKDILYASLWGAKGYFAPEKKTYAYVDPYRAYWLALSDRVHFVDITERKQRFISSLIDSLSLFLIPDDDYMLGYGIDKNSEGGLFLIEENRPPIRVLFQDQKIDKNITSLTLFRDVVYFGNVDGGVYRIK